MTPAKSPPNWNKLNGESAGTCNLTSMSKKAIIVMPVMSPTRVEMVLFMQGDFVLMNNP